MVPVVKSVLEVDRVIASSAVCLNRFNDIVNPFEAAHFFSLSTARGRW
jgi:hypothetical protein